MFIIHSVGGLSLQQCMLGMEFSGHDPSGRRVMGLLAAKGLATSVAADKRFLWNVPSTWSVSRVCVGVCVCGWVGVCVCVCLRYVSNVF